MLLMNIPDHHTPLYIDIKQILRDLQMEVAERDEVGLDNCTFEAGRNALTLELTKLGGYDTVAKAGMIIAAELHAKHYEPFNENVGFMVLELEKNKLETIIVIDYLRAGRICREAEEKRIAEEQRKKAA